MIINMNKMKNVEIELYSEGFHNFGINCFDEPIAYVSGIFNKKKLLQLYLSILCSF